jgi:hypothetical protein
MLFLRAAFFVAFIAAFAACFPSHVRAQQAAPSPSPAATQSPPSIPSPQPTAEDPKIHKLAVQQFLAWQQGQIDRTVYADQIGTQLTDDVVSEASKALANLGALQSATFRGISHAKQGDLYVYHMACDRGAVDMDFAVDPKGKILSIYFN